MHAFVTICNVFLESFEAKSNRFRCETVQDSGTKHGQYLPLDSFFLLLESNLHLSLSISTRSAHQTLHKALHQTNLI